MNATVGPDLDGVRLDVAVATLAGLSRNQASARITDGLVRVDGDVRRRANQRVRTGQRLEVEAPTTPQGPPPPSVPPVRYLDDHLLIVAKPAGLVVHPGPGHVSGTLVDALRDAGYPLAAAAGADRPGIVHRLDRDTSGLLVVASSDEAYHGLVAALQQRQVTRRYRALVAGVPAQARGRIEAPIGRDPRDRKRFAVVAESKPSTTRYEVLATGRVGSAEVALLSCELLTGRTHQIRVHLTELGHPVVGDPTYGPRPKLASALELRRPFLHAAELALTHPLTGEPIALSEPLPDALAGALERAGIARDGSGPWRR